MRDDFSARDKQVLAQRSGLLCSNPDCRALTIGPEQAGPGAINLGVAAHITAASPGGPRYDDLLTPEQRSDLANAIWLCQTCAKLVDSNDPRFSAALLGAWKAVSEDRASIALGRSVPSPNETREQRLLRAIGPWLGKTVTLAHMSTGRALLVSGPIRGTAPVQIDTCNEFFITIDAGGTKRSVSLANIDVAYDHRDQRLQLQERYE